VVPLVRPFSMYLCLFRLRGERDEICNSTMCGRCQGELEKRYASAKYERNEKVPSLFSCSVLAKPSFSLPY